MKSAISILIVSVLILISCKSQKEQPNTENNPKEKVENTNNEPKFSLEEIAGTYQIYYMHGLENLETVQPYITFQTSGNISGVNGCNSFFGRALPISNKSVFDKMGSTRMACDDQKGEVESVFMDLMSKITNIRGGGNNGIEFLIENKVVMKGMTVKLEGSYKINTFNERKVTSLGMVFNVAEYRINGNTGCNSFSSQIVQDGFKLEISETSATEMACDNFDSGLESEFLSILQVTNRYTINKGVYTFYENNKPVFTAVKE